MEFHGAWSFGLGVMIGERATVPAQAAMASKMAAVPSRGGCFAVLLKWRTSFRSSASGRALSETVK